jgi:hypothetical protein
LVGRIRKSSHVPMRSGKIVNVYSRFIGVKYHKLHRPYLLSSIVRRLRVVSLQAVEMATVWSEKMLQLLRKMNNFHSPGTLSNVICVLYRTCPLVFFLV